MIQAQEEIVPLEQIETRAACEDAIRKGLVIWYEVGDAFLKIRDQRLYRWTHPTFEAYCNEEWDMSRRNADRLIAASEVANNLRPIGLIPGSEAQARELTGFTADQQQLIWYVVQQTAPDGHVTAKHVKSVATVLKDVVNTGAIDNGEGESIPTQAASMAHLKAAVTEETYERMKRQEAYISTKVQAPPAQCVYEGFATMLDSGLEFDIPLNLVPGKRYKVKAYEVLEE